MSLLYLVQVSSASPFRAANGSTINFTAPYSGVSLALNILLTIAIVLRLLFYRRQIERALGKEHAANYAGIAAMVVESAALYSAFSLFFLIPFGLNSPIANISLQVLDQIQAWTSAYKNAETLLTYFRLFLRCWLYFVWPKEKGGRAIPRVAYLARATQIPINLLLSAHANRKAV